MSRAFMSTALSRDGRILAAGHDDGTVSLFDVSTLRPISTFWAVPRGPVRGMGYIPHTRLLVVGGDGGFLESSTRTPAASCSGCPPLDRAAPGCRSSPGWAPKSRPASAPTGD